MNQFLSGTVLARHSTLFFLESVLEVAFALTSEPFSKKRGSGVLEIVFGPNIVLWQEGERIISPHVWVS